MFSSLVPILIFSIHFALADTPVMDSDPHLDSLPCAAELRKLLNRWGSKNEWRRQFTEGNSHSQYQTPTDKIGVWLELYTRKQDSPILVRASNQSRTRITWVGSRCLPRLSLDTIKINEKKLSKAFTDFSLIELFKSQKKGALYIWSPHMPFSFQGWENILASAKKASIEVTPILDPYATPGAPPVPTPNHKLLLEKSKPLESMELLRRGVTTHFPSVVLFQDGKIVGPVYPGVKSEFLYDKFIKDYFHED